MTNPEPQESRMARQILLLAADTLAAADDGGDRARWHKILKTGIHKGKPLAGVRDPEITDGHIQEMVDTFTVERPVDVNHALGLGRLDPESTKARGWIKELRKAGDYLEALIEWTEDGAELIASKAFRYFSIELGRVPGTEESPQRRVTGGTLLNNPFIEGLPALAFGRGVEAALNHNEPARTGGGIHSPPDPHGREKEDSHMSNHLELMSKAVGQPVSEDEFAERFAALQANVAKAEELETQYATAQDEIAELKAAKTASTEEIATLAEEQGKMNARFARMDEDAAIEVELSREAMAKAEAGTFDEPGIARKIRRDSVENFDEAYGKRADKYITGAVHGSARTKDEPPQPDTKGITEPDAARDFLVEQADLYMEAHEDINYTTASARVIRDLKDEGQRLHQLMEEGY